MGHLVNPRGFRVGPTLPWPNRSFSPRLPLYALYAQDHAALTAYMASLFASAPLAHQGLAFSHLTLGRGVRGHLWVRAYYYDGLLEILVLRHLLRRLRRNRRAPRRRSVRATLRKFPYRTSALRPILADRSNDYFHRLILRRFAGDLGRRWGATLVLRRLNSASITPRLVALHILAKLRRVVPLRPLLVRLVRHFRRTALVGLRIRVAGRYTRAEMAASRTEAFGTVPLSTLAAPLDYGTHALPLKYGVTGVKVWFHLPSHE